MDTLDGRQATVWGVSRYKHPGLKLGKKSNHFWLKSVELILQDLATWLIGSGGMQVRQGSRLLAQFSPVHICIVV